MSESTTLIAPATAAQKTAVDLLFEPVRLGRYDLREGAGVRRTSRRFFCFAAVTRFYSKPALT